ncbi:MAG: hypothetical protein NC452_11625 [Eubacterium sp.]|nr:hypothetical protein [Eubacterium sp.]
MLDKLKEKRSKPWSKKKKIIFLSVLGAVIVYLIVSTIISGNEVALPSLNLSINGLDAILLCLLGIGLVAVKIRAYLKRRKDDKEK